MQAWSRYWATGARHSCPTSFADHYGCATQHFWIEQFGQMGAQDHVLELGCGNGSLIRFMASQDICLPRRMDAIDASVLDTVWQQSLPEAWQSRLTVWPAVDARRLPLADGSVNHVYSQYALEYIAREDGAPSIWTELARVAAPQARLALIVHHRQSHLTQVAAAEREHCDWMLRENGVFALAQQALPLFTLAATPAGRQRLVTDAGAQMLRAQLNMQLDALSARAAALPHAEVLDESARALMRVLHLAGAAPEPARQALQNLRQRLEDNRLRVAELVDAAVDTVVLDEWRHRLRDVGFMRMNAMEIHEQNLLFGWGIEASREAA